MTPPDTDAGLRRVAERRVNARIGFGIHALVYVAVNTLLITVNLLTTPHQLWFFFPLLGWGIGLVAHGLSVYAVLSGVRERAVGAEMQRLRERQARPDR
ncbi:MAG TPA: 2TM domain-containing protein [Caulobacteraceae bacterium]|nr:2TM domain-containing protein [Caulobacteraceae bacterium]